MFLFWMGEGLLVCWFGGRGARGSVIDMGWIGGRMDADDEEN